jgi:hypothetical protein
MYKVMAIPPVARIPQRTVFGEDMVITTLYPIFFGSSRIMVLANELA